MKKLLLVALTFGTPTAAMAADLPSREAALAPVVVAVASPTWSGVYGGLNAGYSFGSQKQSYRYDPTSIWWDSTQTLDAVIRGVRSDSKGSFMGGLQVGYNFQSGSLVFGVETDMNYAGLSSRTLSVINTPTEAEAIGSEHKINWFGTLRARLGVSVTPSVLLYATGGLAYGSVKSSSLYGYAFNDGVNTETAALSGSRSNTRVGWTVGGGLEYGLARNWSLKAEYLYVDLGSDTLGLSGVSSLNVPFEYRVQNDAKFSVGRIGLNYRFGG